MMDDQKKTSKKEDRLEKAKGRLQQSFPEVQQLIRTSNAVDVARKIIDPAQSIFRQFADDIQLKDLLAKVEALVANTNLTFTKPVSKDTPATPTFRDATPASESSKEVGTKKTPAKRARLKKAAPKNALSKKKKKPAPKRNLHRRHARATGRRPAQS
jgi:hypothetical protein